MVRSIWSKHLNSDAHLPTGNQGSIWIADGSSLVVADKLARSISLHCSTASFMERCAQNPKLFLQEASLQIPNVSFAFGLLQSSRYELLPNLRRIVGGGKIRQRYIERDCWDFSFALLKKAFRSIDICASREGLHSNAGCVRD